MKRSIAKRISSFLVLAMLLSLIVVPVSATSINVTADTTNTNTQTDPTFNISGSITDPVANQQVTMVVYDSTQSTTPNESNIVYIDQVEADAQGNYSKAFTVPEELKGKELKVKVGASAVSTATNYSIMYGTTPPPIMPEATVVVDVANSRYLGTSLQYEMVAITLDTATPENYTVTYKGVNMLYSPERKKFVGIAPIADASATVVAEGTANKVYYGGDLAGDGISPFDLLNVVKAFKTPSAATMAQYIGADVNGDGRITLSDINHVMDFRSGNVTKLIIVGK